MSEDSQQEAEQETKWRRGFDSQVACLVSGCKQFMGCSSSSGTCLSLQVFHVMLSYLLDVFVTILLSYCALRDYFAPATYKWEIW